MQLSGATMGTFWQVSAIDLSGESDADRLRHAIEEQLERVNASMSTYRADSELSRFNRWPVNEWFAASDDFFLVLSTALDIGEKADGAYDVTVAPLVDLWGFGPDGPIAGPPSEHAISDLLGRVGQSHLRIDPAARAVLKTRELSVDLSSVAKGYAVDLVAERLLEHGIHDFMAEVGGELRLAGVSGRGDPWRIAIEEPRIDRRAVARVVHLTDIAVATSGDYRNVFEADGQSFSHAIDPRSGRPIAHDLVSVTVLHPSCMHADAWATALLVLGGDAAMAVAQEQQLAVYFIRRAGETFVQSHTDAFSPYIDGELVVDAPGS